MQGFCDSCDERADQLFDITRLPEFVQVVRAFNYRHVCQACYDDLLEESKKPQPKSQEDERRFELRHDLRLEVQIEGTNREGHTFCEKTVTEDVSQSGTRIITHQDVEVGSVLKLRVLGSDFEGTAIVELMWKHPTARSAGLKIVEQSGGWDTLLQERVKL